MAIDEADVRPSGIPPKLAAVLDRRAPVIELLLVLATLATAFVVLGYLASYFEDYLHLILIFFFAWLLAFLISPVADFLQRRMRRLPRPLAVIAVIVPVILIGAYLLLRIAVAIGTSLADLAESLPGLAAEPPAFIADIQAFLDARGIDVDVAATFESMVGGLLHDLADLAADLLVGIVGSFGTFIDAIIIVSLAVFMAIDKDKLLRFGLDMTPPDKREEALLFRRSVGSAFAGFIRSQLVLGALYGVWALLTSLLFGLPFALGTAALAGVIMAIPIYGPYVSWLPPVIVAVLVSPESALLVAVVMLIGWFIDENILAPLVRAGALELHPIIVTLAFLLGAQLAGAIGALVAIPLAAVVQAFFQRYMERYRASRGWPSADHTLDAAGDASPG
jgi:predicted PurR-regulated permease PerM